MRQLVFLPLLLAASTVTSQIVRTLGPFQEVFAWKQITFNIQGSMPLQDRFGELDVQEESTSEGVQKRHTSDIVFHNDNEGERDWNTQNSRLRTTTTIRPSRNTGWNRPSSTSTTTPRPSSDESRQFFVQYNNLPMGVERVGRRVFITLPRRRYGIPATLNYLHLDQDSNTRSPSLRPYPNFSASSYLTSVYRTRADRCGRLWMVDTGMLEIPNNRQQVQPPAIVVYDLNTDRPILRYNFKTSDIPSAITPTGLASITVDIPDNDCNDAYAYVPDLATYGLIVFSLKSNDSWRLSHNFFSFNPLVGNLNLAGQRFQWNDGIFSITLTNPTSAGCRDAFFHAMIGTDEFSVSTCTLRNRTASEDSNFWSLFSIIGNRGANSQSTMHGYHAGSNVIFFADIARSAVSCWNTGNPLSSSTVGILASDTRRLGYPSGKCR
ncbi:L-dopachrome tautomerase yellow-f2-like isoform X2 [Hyposmocoma kahamanoa]|uniref:L-dopachrome tautomerase yellow-f2-like isoform X2 n=1 Tax=Hyposmocoma kahamanoa TaxID=1477025 RepID=UPI000E6DA02C|nr:L-dopachrome tautomerase yellow-f2-like isoform X2 [Hyposmocoma kahamanoa]